jgi:hypothetical protein
VRAKECADAFAQTECQDFEQLPAACDTFLVPNALMHQPCFDGFRECADGVCRGAACPKTCQPKGITGEVCTTDSDCRGGLFCRMSSTTLGLGQCATFGLDGTACDDASRCAGGLACVFNKCVVLPSVGTRCLDSRCDESAYCGTGVDVDGGWCIPRRAAFTSCAGAECVSETFCSPVHLECVPKNLGDAGVSCESGQNCPKGLVCRGRRGSMPGLCAPPGQRGEACTTAQDCSPQYTCLETADAGFTCRPRARSAAACVTSADCQLHASCVGGRCVRLPDLSEECAASGICLRGTCERRGDAGSLCVPLFGPGHACSTGDVCGSGRCEQNGCLAACTP